MGIFSPLDLFTCLVTIIVCHSILSYLSHAKYQFNDMARWFYLLCWMFLYFLKSLTFVWDTVKLFGNSLIFLGIILGFVSGPREAFGANFFLILRQYFLSTLLHARTLCVFHSGWWEHDLFLALCKLWGVYHLLILLDNFLTPMHWLVISPKLEEPLPELSLYSPVPDS